MTQRLITHLRHVDLAVPDHAKQLDFYTNTWGLTAEHSDSGIAFLAAEGSPEQYVVRLRQTDDKRIDLISFGAATPADVDTLAEQVAADGFEPDLILSIARGGLFLGGALGYALDVKNLFVMNVEFYTGVDERLEVPRILPPAPDFVDLGRARILIADDVADTGHTLRSVEQFCEGKVREVRTAVLYQKSHSIVQCDYVWKKTDLWINFPWSDKDPVASRSWAVHDA